MGAHSRAHSANHCWHPARCSGLSPWLGASFPLPPGTASWLSSSSLFSITLSFSSCMVSSSLWVTWWGTQLLSMEVRKGSGAQTSMSSLPVGMRR
ncbi:hypothetical protein N300_14176 [Calypte anna]|uniref:Uncharacterized protein n=1 Tax=Calypte anna TaxID=9244 RepID=A0A091HK08_CALAN|nr:hypothetical protein N300_14176 [Calypte anna]